MRSRDGREHWSFKLKAWYLLTCSAVLSLSASFQSAILCPYLFLNLLAGIAQAISRLLSAIRVNWPSFSNAVAVILLDNQSMIGGSRFFPSHKFAPQGASFSCKVSKFLPISPKVHRNFLSRVSLICLHSPAQNMKIYVDVLSLFSVIFIQIYLINIDNCSGTVSPAISNSLQIKSTHYYSLFCTKSRIPNEKYHHQGQLGQRCQ